MTHDKLTPTFNADYAHDAGHLLSRWLILIVIALFSMAGHHSAYKLAVPVALKNQWRKR